MCCREKFEVAGPVGVLVTRIHFQGFQAYGRATAAEVGRCQNTVIDFRPIFRSTRCKEKHDVSPVLMRPNFSDI